MPLKLACNDEDIEGAIGKAIFETLQITEILNWASIPTKCKIIQLQYT